MIIGTGCDIVHISRMEKIVPLFKSGIKQHVLSLTEQKELAQKDFNDEQISRFLAKRFAAKEALSKALGTGFRDGMKMSNITIHHNELGKPFIEAEGKVLDTLLEKTQMQDYKIHLSLSDDRNTVIAFAVIELL